MLEPRNYPPKPLIILQVPVAQRDKNVMETRIRLGSNNPKGTELIYIRL